MDYVKSRDRSSRFTCLQLKFINHYKEATGLNAKVWHKITKANFVEHVQLKLSLTIIIETHDLQKYVDTVAAIRSNKIFGWFVSEV